MEYQKTYVAQLTSLGSLDLLFEISKAQTKPSCFSEDSRSLRLFCGKKAFVAATEKRPGPKDRLKMLEFRTAGVLTQGRMVFPKEQLIQMAARGK